MRSNRIKRKVGNHKGERGDCIAERARNAKERVTEYVDERGEGNREKRRGRRGGSRQGRRSLDRGVKSGDLQVQLEQPVTLMVH